MPVSTQTLNTQSFTSSSLSNKKTNPLHSNGNSNPSPSKDKERCEYFHTHRIHPEDTLEGLSLVYGVPIQHIKLTNNLYTAREFHARRFIKIPLLSEDVATKISAADIIGEESLGIRRRNRNRSGSWLGCEEEDSLEEGKKNKQKSMCRKGQGQWGNGNPGRKSSLTPCQDYGNSARGEDSKTADELDLYLKQIDSRLEKANALSDEALERYNSNSDDDLISYHSYSTTAKGKGKKQAGRAYNKQYYEPIPTRTQDMGGLSKRRCGGSNNRNSTSGLDDGTMSLEEVQKCYFNSPGSDYYHQDEQSFNNTSSFSTSSLSLASSSSSSSNSAGISRTVLRAITSLFRSSPNSSSASTPSHIRYSRCPTSSQSSSSSLLSNGVGRRRTSGGGEPLKAFNPSSNTFIQLKTLR
eukprot:Nk52_evm40s158 gene=Nk52_evmTU40s158